MISDPAAGTTRLKEFRGERGWTQASWRGAPGSRARAVSAIEINRLIPSVSAALKLAACLECTVEQLFGTAPAVQNVEWAWLPTTQQSRFWQAEVAGRLLLYPCEETAAGELSHDGIASRDAVAPTTSGNSPRPARHRRSSSRGVTRRPACWRPSTRGRRGCG